MTPPRSLLLDILLGPIAAKLAERESDERTPPKSTRCEVCGAKTAPGGYAGTGLCGPCCTGDSSTLEEGEG